MYFSKYPITLKKSVKLWWSPFLVFKSLTSVLLDYSFSRYAWFSKLQVFFMLFSLLKIPLPIHLSLLTSCPSFMVHFKWQFLPQVFLKALFHSRCSYALFQCLLWQRSPLLLLVLWSYSYLSDLSSLSMGGFQISYMVLYHVIYSYAVLKTKTCNAF